MEQIKLRFEDRVAVVTFHRPEARNAISAQMLQELGEALDAIEAAEDVRAIVFTGEGKAFIAGADTKILGDPDVIGVLNYTVKGRDLFRRVEALPIPSIAAVNGYAFGGGLEFALSCDIRLAAGTAKMGLPETGIGIIPGFSGSQRLPRLVGSARAKQMIFTGKPVDAAQALEWGLVNQVSEPETLLEDALDMARTIAANSPNAVALAKKAIDMGASLPLEAAMELESGYHGFVFGSANQREGFAAMQEKRPPAFVNRAEGGKQGGAE